eukprot:2595759-Amphidinium_carterae.1
MPAASHLRNWMLPLSTSHERQWNIQRTLTHGMLESMPLEACPFVSFSFPELSGPTKDPDCNDLLAQSTATDSLYQPHSIPPVQITITQQWPMSSLEIGSLQFEFIGDSVAMQDLIGSVCYLLELLGILPIAEVAHVPEVLLLRSTRLGTAGEA